jgi:hypothetical protein
MFQRQAYEFRRTLSPSVPHSLKNCTLFHFGSSSSEYFFLSLSPLKLNLIFNLFDRTAEYDNKTNVKLVAKLIGPVFEAVSRSAKNCGQVSKDSHMYMNMVLIPHGESGFHSVAFIPNTELMNPRGSLALMR